MLLSLRERLVLVRVLPVEGSLLTMKVVTALRDDLLPTEQERVDWKIIESEDGVIRWGPGLPQDVEIHVPLPVVGIITEALQELDKQKKLTAEHLSLCEKFLEDSI